MTQVRRAVAVDIGNTAVKVAFDKRGFGERGFGEKGKDVVPGRELVRWSVSLADPDWANACVRRVVSEAGLPQPGSGSNVRSEWWVASVHRDAARRFRDAAAALGIDSGALKHVTREDVPMGGDVDFPDRLGIDRLLGGWGAFLEFRSSLVVVDIGSAVTVDLVIVDQRTGKGRFGGGAIMPGISLQSAALARGTDALPIVGWVSSETDKNLDRLVTNRPATNRPATNRPATNRPATNRAAHPGAKLVAPGKNTEDAIRLGILAGIAGGIEKIVQTYREGMQETEDRRPLQVVVTGGDAERIRPSLNVAHHHRPDLVCRALLDLSKLRCSSPAPVQVEETHPSD